MDESEENPTMEKEIVDVLVEVVEMVLKKPITDKKVNTVNR